LRWKWGKLAAIVLFKFLNYGEELFLGVKFLIVGIISFFFCGDVRKLCEVKNIFIKSREKIWVYFFSVKIF
jgi:hypothetical protein